jgi:hypothetical protein
VWHTATMQRTTGARGPSRKAVSLGRSWAPTPACSDTSWQLGVASAMGRATRATPSRSPSSGSTCAISRAMVVAAKEGAARAEALNRYDCETFVSVASRVGSLRELAIRGLGDLDAGQRRAW